MFFRNVWSAAELTNSCKPVLFKRHQVPLGNVRVARNTFHNSRRGARRPGLEPDPLEHLHIEAGPLHARRLVKPLIFTIGVSTASLAGCVIWEYETLRAHASTLLKRPGNWLNAQQKKVFAQFHKNEPGPLKKWWNSLKDSEKVFYPILAANVLVFGAWRVKSLQPYMIKYFCSNPSGSAVCLPMLFSTFSHYSALHLAANMYVLYSFMPAAVSALGKEQFTAMYLSAGVISSFASFLYKVMLNQPGLSLGAFHLGETAGYSYLNNRRTFIPFLMLLSPQSGAIMSVLAYVCVQYPDTRLSIIFLPMYTFAAGSAIKVIMGIDLAGVVCGWKFFDHAAHLGGALFGIAWCHWIDDYIWGNRAKFLQYYHNIRKNDTGR